MKAVLVIDMPKDCWGCPAHTDGLDDENEEIMVCNANARESHYGEKPSWCPLKPLPHSKQMENRWFSDDYSKGWNECLAEIDRLEQIVMGEAE